MVYTTLSDTIRTELGAGGVNRYNMRIILEVEILICNINLTLWPQQLATSDQVKLLRLSNWPARAFIVHGTHLIHK